MTDDVPPTRPPHLHYEKSRHGKWSWYVRIGHGPRTRLRAPYGSAEFWAAYRDAMADKPPPAPDKPAHGTIAWLFDLYVSSAEWSDLSPATRKQRHAVFREMESKVGTKPIATLTRDAILKGRDRRRDRPHAANNLLKALRGLSAWAIERSLIKTNPTTGIKLLAGKNDDAGFHAWTEGEVSKFEARWPLGTRQRLALDLLLFTGLRRGDAVKLGRQHVREGEFTIRTEKTSAVVTRPILPVLARTIAASPTGDLAFLVTERGAPFGSKESFGTWFGKACRAAGVPGAAHGLRKCGARRAAEAGATEAQLNALFGWAPGSRESAVYTRTADNARLARSAPVLPAPATTKSRTSRKGK